MNEERNMILNMLKEGSITVEEAEKLLETISEQEQKSNPPAIRNKIKPKTLIVEVMEGGRQKVNVRIPFSLVRAGLKLGKASIALGAKYTTNGEEREVLDLLREVDLDEIMNSLDDGDITLPYTIVDVNEVATGELVKVIIE